MSRAVVLTLDEKEPKGDCAHLLECEAIAAAMSKIRRKSSLW